MSENDQPDARTDRAISAAIELLDGEASAEPTAGEMRPWIELLGLLPRQLEPIEPPAEVKQALMKRLRGRAVDHVSRFEASAAESTPLRSPMHWAYKAAAVLAIALLGVSAKQAVDLADSNQRLNEQAGRIADLQETLDGFEPSSGAPDWMAASGTELCELRPQLAATKQSKGWLFVREDHQHWYVAVEGLEPSPEGHTYQLWFMAGGEPVSGGTFEPGPDGRVSLTSESMPSEVTGIAITLEPVDGDDTPSDAMVLYGDEVMLTL